MAERRLTHKEAATFLAKRDPVMQFLVDSVGPPKFRPPKESHFASLAQSVLYQQLAGRAAATIHGRFLDLLDHDVTPESVLAVAFEDLRSVGLSNNKALSICDLAEKLVDGDIDLSPRRIARLGDEELIQMLSSVRGIGRWTAQMFLMFQLRRLDIWPTGDLGVRKGYGFAWSMDMPSEKELDPIGDRFMPYRSVVAWYCWRACEIYSDKSKI